MSDDDGGYAWATELGEGALKDAGVSLLGYGLSSLGVGFPNATDDAIGRLQSELNKIENQIVHLQNEMDSVLTAIDRSEYDTRAQSLDSIMDSISNISGNLHDALCISQNSSTPPRLADLTNPAKAADKAEIIRQIEAANLVTQLSVIHDGVMGPADGISLYQLLNTLILAKHRFISHADCLMLQNQMDYYQNAQYTQLWLVVEYYRAKGSTDLIDRAMETIRGNVYNELLQFGVTPQIVEGTVVDSKGKLLYYVADNPYVDFASTGDALFQIDALNLPLPGQWRLPTVAELLGDENTVGLFKGYDSSDGTPPQWLTKHGFPKDMTGIHFWTSTQIPAPDPNDYQVGTGEDCHVDTGAYLDAYYAWQAAGPPQYCVDSSNLNCFAVSKPDQAHVVAVQTLDAAHSVPLFNNGNTLSNT
jgi:hypothetical protein